MIDVFLQTTILCLLIVRNNKLTKSVFDYLAIYGGGSMKRSINSNILLTGTINVNPSFGGQNKVVLSNLCERLSQYERAITRYICDTQFNKIVFVETSNYPLDYDKFESLARQNGKQFEYLPFEGSYELVKQKGKSVGDAEAINYALCNSKILNNEETIYKITGRLFLLNSNEILKTKDRVRNEFFAFRKREPSYRCKTYFFKFNRKDYMDYFLCVPDLVDERIDMDMETVFYKRIIESGIEHKAFKKYPRITGVIAGLGTTYDKSNLEYIIGDFLIKTGFYDIK